MIDNINCLDFDFMNTFIQLLDKGIKFIPCVHKNEFDTFISLLYNFDKYFAHFNKQLFILSKNKSSDIQANCAISVCNDLECIFKKATKTIATPNLPLINESIDFRFNFYKNISTLQFNYQRNITQSEYSAMNKFLNTKPFIVAECDKNTGVSIISSSLYNELSNEMLNDTQTYSKLDFDPLDNTISTIDNILNALENSGDISKCIAKKLVVNKPKLGSFRLLPKLHKTKFSSRPIINCISHPTSNICLLIDLILKPFVMETESYIQDSQNLIQKTQDLNLPDDCKLYSCDFESLYTNIRLDHALLIISEFISINLKSKFISSYGFYKLLEVAFYNNVFQFDDQFYLQINGIAMGSKCGPSIANIYVYCLEKKFLTIHKPLIYYRFIDDIFICTSNNFNIDNLTNGFDYLKLNVVSSNTVNFLDLNIELGRLSRTLEFSVYIKPTQTFNYLLWTSNHPKFIFNNIPKSIFIRIRRICTNYWDYLFMSRRITGHLIQRGYELNTLGKISRMVGDIDRDKLIPYKIKDNNIFRNSVYFKMPFDFNYMNLEQVFRSSFENISSNNNFNNKSIITLNSMQNNFSALFIHGGKIDKIKYFSYKKCEKRTCVICNYSKSENYLQLNKFSLPIMTNSSCTSKNVIYILCCTRCQFFYIGTTDNFNRRFKEHFRSITRRVNYADNRKAVHNHFYNKQHNIYKDLCFYIFKSNIEDLASRLNQEIQLIYLFKTLKINLINDYFADIYKYKIQFNLFSK